MGASVTVTSDEQSQKRIVKTDNEGRYIVSFLQPGTYSLLATAKAFGRVSRAGIKLEVAQSALVDLALPLETVQETVMVTE